MKLDALDHPKTHALTSYLGIKRPTAIGHLELLWAFVGKHAPQGNIGKHPDGAIAKACDWSGKPERFIEGLLRAGFIETHDSHRYLVHDWHEHAPGWVRAKLKGLRQEFLRSPMSTAPGSTPGSPPGTRPSIQGKGREGKGSTSEGFEQEGAQPIASPPKPTAPAHARTGNLGQSDDPQSLDAWTDVGCDPTAMRNWVEHRDRSGKPLPAHARIHAAQILRGMGAAEVQREAVSTAIANNWQSLRVGDGRAPGGRNGRGSFEERHAALNTPDDETERARA